MRKKYQTALLLLTCLLSGTLTAWAQENTIAFQETFDTNTGTGGRDGQFSGNVGSSKPLFDNEDWNASNSTKIYGAKDCIKFGTGNVSSKISGVCTTPDIMLVSPSNPLKLTFDAAGWSDDYTKTLTVTATGATLSGNTNITLESATWNSYTVTITPTEYVITLTFTGWRGFLDNIVVTETVNNVPAPTLQAEFSFWPNTTEPAQSQATLETVGRTTVRYTTDGSTPSKTTGTVCTLQTNIPLTATTTVKAIAYVEGVTMTSPIVERTYTAGATTVESIAAFTALANGTEARLHLSNDQNARITFTSGNAAYLRDNTGAICFDLGTTAVFNPTPAFEQHVAGWIVGVKQEVNGLPTLVANSNTNTRFLALANRRNEPVVEPKEIAANDINSNLADWVAVKDVRIGTYNVNNKFSLTSPMPYDDALVDLNGIVVGDNLIAPSNQPGYTPVVFVVNENEHFTSPAEDISGASVRLVRTLDKDYWNTFCVPFAITDLEGNIREYDETDGTTMKFKNAASIEAGTPYLVKPTATIENPTYSNVTLKSTAAQEVGETYKFVGTYSPKTLAGNNTQRYLGKDGKLYYSDGGSDLKGTRAYFDVPANANLALVIDGETTAITQVESQPTAERTIYDLQGRKIATPGKGLYIVNGKKMVIH